MELLEEYLDTIQREASINIGGFKAGSWNIGGSDGITIYRFGDDFRFDIGTKGEEMIQGGAVVAGAMLALVLIRMSYGIYKNYLNKYGRKCRGYKGIDRVNCIKRVKAMAVEKRITALNNSKEKCKITKNPSKCVSDINAKVEKLKNKLDMHKASLMKKGV